MIPSLPELPAPPKRIIVHWTGGGYTPNRVDLSAYHFVVDGHGRVHAGVPVAANMRGIPGNTTTSEYGAHCARMNSFSVGVSYAAMAGARKGGTYGPSPLTEAQFLAGLEFVARCCRAWQLSPGDARQLLTHAEVERVYGVKQKDKWDIEVLPWDGTLGASRIGDLMRTRVAALMEGLEKPRVAAPAGPDLPQPRMPRDFTPAVRREAPTVAPAPASVAKPPALWRRVIRIFRGDSRGG